MRISLHSIAALFLSLPIAVPALGATEPGAGFHVLRYDLELSPDLQNKTLIGVEVIKLRSVTDDLRSIAFSPNALAIDSATIDGKPVQMSTTPDALSLDLQKALKKGKSVTLRIAYHGTPKHGATFTPTSVYTSYATCDWMVCSEDTPGDKSIFTLRLHVPAGMTSIATGKELGKSKGKDGTEVDRWRTEMPYSAYLYDFAIGNFTSTSTHQDGADLLYLSDIATAPELQAMFGETGSMVKFLSEKAGMGLPAKGYTQLLVTGSEAQEAATYSIIGKNNIDPKDDWALIHELAHQWWGNSITCATWKDFWLNESFATYMTAAWKQQHYGQAGYDEEMNIARTRYDKLKAKGLDWPLAYGGKYPSIGNRRVIQYSKGALFLDHLRTLVGDDAFWAGVRTYTREHAGGTVTSIDFERSMEKASGRNLSDVFGEWVFGK